MAMPLSTAKTLSKSKMKKGRAISEYADKASAVNKKARNGATNRRRSKK